MKPNHKLKIGDKVKLINYHLYGIIESLVYSPLGYLAYEIRWIDGENPAWVENNELDFKYEEELEESK